MPKQDRLYLRTYRIRTGRQPSLTIPIEVLAATIREHPDSALVEHLGPEMVQAIKVAGKDAA